METPHQPQLLIFPVEEKGNFKVESLKDYYTLMHWLGAITLEIQQEHPDDTVMIVWENNGKA